MNASILLVEDNQLNRRLARDVLELRGHTVTEACNVAEGRAEIAKRRPDLVLLDIGLPGGGGGRLLFEIRADPRLAGLPIIAVTAFAMPGDRERLLATGFDGYLSKPINVHTFAADVEAFLQENL